MGLLVFLLRMTPAVSWVLEKLAQSNEHTQLSLAQMSFDDILHLTALFFFVFFCRKVHPGRYAYRLRSLHLKILLLRI